MTSVIAVIGAHTVSADILEMDIWRESLGVGRWTLILKNPVNKWGGSFLSSNVVELKINDTSMLKGRVDDVIPHLDERGVYTNNIQVVGRDYGRDLARLFCTAEYGDWKGDDAIDDLLSKTGSEITYTSGSAGGIVNILRRRTYLIDWAREIGKRINWEGYADDAKLFHFFPVGHVGAETAVDLKSIADAMDNNILNLLKGEAIGFSIANYTELSAGSVKDHYTDGNAADMTPGVDTQVANESTIKFSGITSIKFWSSAVDKRPSIMLDFNLSAIQGYYSHVTLDLSDPDEMSFCVRHNNVADEVMIRPCLVDGDGNEIRFSRGKETSRDKGKTWPIPSTSDGADAKLGWELIKFSTGISPYNAIRMSEVQDKWFWPSTPYEFDWSNVKKIGFMAEARNPVPPPITQPLSVATNIYIDNLCIPNIEAISILEDAASQAEHGKSMWFDQRTDIKSQIELVEINESELAKRKDPLQWIRIFASGQTGSKYAAQSLDVQAPGHGIAELTKYRIATLHHKVRVNPINKGFDFTTEYDLVKHTTSPDTQVIDLTRFSLASDPHGTLIEIQRQTHRRMRTAEGPQHAQFGDPYPASQVFYSGHGNAFPRDPVDGFIFRLDIDITGYLAAVYEYDADTEDWIRDPITLYRTSDPPSGTEVVGDILNRTDLMQTFIWNGSTWEFQSTYHLSKMEGDLDDVDDGSTYNKILAEYVDTGKALVKALNQIQDELITIGKIQDWTIGTTAPPSPDQGHIWLDTNVSPPQMKRWDGSNWKRLDVITLIDMGGDLDDIDDGSTYGRILLTAIQAGKILLAEVIGDLSDIDGDIDDIADGTTYGRIKLTSMQAGEILLAEAIGDLDDLLDGSIYGKIKITALQAGLVLIAEAVGDLDDIEDGSTHGKVLVTSISGGKILVGQLDGDIDDMVDGDTYARMLKNWRASDVTYIDGGKLYAGTWIESKKFRTAPSPNPRIEFDSTGIYGYSDATTKQFYILTDGKAYAGGGAVILDSWGVTIKGEALRFYGTATLQGIMHGKEAQNELNITAYEDMQITVLGGGAPLGDLTLNAQGAVRPPIDAVRDLGKPGYTWRFYVPITTLASRPAAHSDYAGLLWITEETTGAKSLLWICMRNDVSTYEWVQLGLTT